jgi:hypothetical protein
MGFMSVLVAVLFMLLDSPATLTRVSGEIW